MEATRDIDQHRQVLTAARETLAVLGEALHNAYNGELAELMGEVDGLVAAGSGVRAEITLEAVRRGVTIEFGRSTREWVFEYAPSLRQAGAGQLAKTVDVVAARTTITAGCVYADPESRVDRESPVAMIWARVRTGEVGAPLAVAAMSEIERLGDRLVPDAIPTVTEGMLAMGIGFGPSGMRDLRARMIATFGLAEQTETDQKKLAKHAFLSSPDVESDGLTSYRLVLTPEQSARLEAAVGPLARPQPNEETGERDLRGNGQRRAEALVELASRSAQLDADAVGGPAHSDACLQVSVSLEDLRQHTGAGEVLHSRADGTLLGIETLRKLCCDADLIPVVLGTDAEVVDVGMAKRLFTRAQRRLLWRRDRSCTYPGCTAPAAWTRAHHVIHWADGGPTDLSNAALLCQRHHTFVHDKRLWAQVRDVPDERGRYVVWDRTPGSYDGHLEQRRALEYREHERRQHEPREHERGNPAA